MGYKVFHSGGFKMLYYFMIMQGVDLSELPV